MQIFNYHDNHEKSWMGRKNAEKRRKSYSKSQFTTPGVLEPSPPNWQQRETAATASSVAANGCAFGKRVGSGCEHARVCERYTPRINEIALTSQAKLEPSGRVCVCADTFGSVTTVCVVSVKKAERAKGVRVCASESEREKECSRWTEEAQRKKNRKVKRLMF